ncbi:hypothetical protein VSR82_21360 [Burkholderia sp. JPY481]|uniref:hypothetical protein n=1 Tax=Paraburkholderia sp. JPY465 TaxID=3042285 RepID=UPI00317ECEC9
MIVVDLPAALWVEKKGYFWLFLAVSSFWLFFLALFFVLLAFPCFVIGLLALPLCGAAPTFFAAAKKVGKEDSFKPLALKRVPRCA